MALYLEQCLTDTQPCPSPVIFSFVDALLGQSHPSSHFTNIAIISRLREKGQLGPSRCPSHFRRRRMTNHCNKSGASVSGRGVESSWSHLGRHPALHGTVAPGCLIRVCSRRNIQTRSSCSSARLRQASNSTAQPCSSRLVGDRSPEDRQVTIIGTWDNCSPSFCCSLSPPQHREIAPHFWLHPQQRGEY